MYVSISQTDDNVEEKIGGCHIYRALCVISRHDGGGGDFAQANKARTL
jgi:hypothetical protein